MDTQPYIEAIDKILDNCTPEELRIVLAFVASYHRPAGREEARA